MLYQHRVIVCIIYYASIAIILDIHPSNCIVTNDAGEVVITSKSAKIQGFLPHSYAPVNSDPARLLTPENLNPIIIVPDIRRSTLEATVLKSEHSLKFCKNKWDYYPIWFKLSNYRPFVIDCWASNFRTHYDAKERKSFSTPGVHVRPKNFGSVVEVEQTIPKLRGPKGYFMHMIESLIGMGYIRDHNLMSATYDWRIAPYENKEFTYFFRKLLEVTYSMNNNKPAIIICHGVGCLYVHHFLVNGINEPPVDPTSRSSSAPDVTDFKSKYVKAMIAINVPWGGYFTGLYTYLNHDNEPLFRTYPVIKAVERTFSSSAYLLPSMDVFGKDVLVQTQFRNYTTESYKDIFLGLGYPNAYNMWLDGQKFSSTLPHPLVDTFVISGLGYKTMEQIVYKTAIDLSDVKNLYKRCRRRIIYGNGDGIVNLKSARRVLSWQNDPHGYKFTYTEFLAKHDDILKNTHAISHILNIVSSLKFSPDAPIGAPPGGGYNEHHEYHHEHSSGAGQEHLGGQNGQQPEPEPYPSSAHTQGQQFIGHHHYPNHDQSSILHPSTSSVSLTNDGNYSVYYHPPNTHAPPTYIGGQDPRSIEHPQITYNRRPVEETKVSPTHQENIDQKVIKVINSESNQGEKIQASAGYIMSKSSTDGASGGNNSLEQQPMAQESSIQYTAINGSNSEVTTMRTLMNVLFDSTKA